VKEMCDVMRGEIVVAKMGENISLAFCRKETNVSCGERLCTEYCTRTEINGIAWLLEGLWKLRGIRKKINKRNSVVC
jgi:hypothetical protein